ncbi:MAG: protein-L-isoaspartate O-methyltransferase family protein [Thioalkalivibrionaceae bacterium]
MSETDNTFDAAKTDAYSEVRRTMVEQQVRPWDVLDPRVLDRLEELPRERFFPPELAGLAYADLELPLRDPESGANLAKALAPKIVGRFAQGARLDTTDTVLEIGTGSGYLTAVLAGLVAHVDSVERHEVLKLRARATLDALGYDNTSLRTQTVTREWTAPRERYDAIIVTGAIAENTAFLERMLAVGGRLIVTVGEAPAMQVQRITRLSIDAFKRETLFETCLDPLAGFAAAPVFEF